MSRIKRMLGLDGIDVLIQFGITVCIMAVGASVWKQADAEIMLATVAGVSLAVFGVRRSVALRRRPPETTGEVAAERLAELEARVGEVDQVYLRLQELEERLDFAERLLAERRSEPAHLEGRR